MKHNTFSTNQSGTGKQLGLKIYLAAMILLCLLAIGMFTYLAVYKGNHNGWPFAAVCVYAIIVCIWVWPKKPKPAHKGFRPNVDFSSASQKFLRTIASQDRPE